MASDPLPSPLDLYRPLKRATFELSTTAWLPQPVEDVFSFFGDAHNLDVITPPWLHFKVLTARPIDMHAGTLIDYRLRLRGFPITWRTRISLWEPSRRFIDEQLRGPYLEWIHTHRFEPADGGTLMTDTVRYRVPGGALVNRLFVEGDVGRIFRFRREALERQFACPAAATGPDVTFRRLR